MARIVVEATVERIVVPEYAIMGMQQEVILRDAVEGGLPLPDGLRVNLTGAMRGLALMPGDRIALVANLDALDRERRVIGADLADVVAFLRGLPREARAGVTFRLRHPGHVRRVRQDRTPSGNAEDGAGSRPKSTRSIHVGLTQLSRTARCE